MTVDPIPFLRTQVSPNALFVEVGEPGPTVEAARFGLEAWRTHATPPPAVMRATLGYLRRCAHPYGGWGVDAQSEQPCLSATYYATKLLAEGHLPEPLRAPEQVQAWLCDQVADDLNVRPAIDIDELYYAVRAAYLIAPARPFPDRVRRSVVEFVLACADVDGGFGRTPGAQADIERSYCSIHMLRLLGAEFEADRHFAWIGRCVRTGAMDWSPDTPTASPATVYWGLRVASLVGVGVPAAAVRDNLAQFVLASGGYGANGQASIWHTYCGVKAAQIVADMGAQDVVTP